MSAGRFSKSLPEVALGAGNGAEAFTLSGRSIGRFDPPGNGGAVAAIDLDGDGLDEILTFPTTQSNGPSMVAFSRSGQIRWTSRVDDLGMLMDPPAFKFKLQGTPVIAVVGGAGIAFISTSGKRVGRISIVISSAARLPSNGSSDRIVMRGQNFLRCYQFGK